MLLEAGIKNFRWHDLQHTFASRLKRAALEDIADLLGHKSLMMTRRYANLGPNKLHALVSLLKRSDPEVTPGKVAFEPVCRKLLCGKEFRGVAQW